MKKLHALLRSPWLASRYQKLIRAKQSEKEITKLNLQALYDPKSGNGSLNENAVEKDLKQLFGSVTKCLEDVSPAKLFNAGQ